MYHSCEYPCKNPTKEEDPSEAEDFEEFSYEADSKEKTNMSNEGSFQQLVQLLTKLKVEMPIVELLEHNPCCLKLLQTLVKIKEQSTNVEWVSLTRDCNAITKAETPVKLEDPGCFNILVSIINETLCDLGASINLMSLATLKKIKGLRMEPTKSMIGISGGTMTEPERVMKNVQVHVEKFIGRPKNQQSTIPDTNLTPSCGQNLFF